MSQEIMDKSPIIENREQSWRALYILGGIAALLAVIFFRRNFGVELVQFRGFGIFSGVPAEAPIRAGDWFTLLKTNPIIGLVLLGLIDLVNYALVGLIFLALFGALVKNNKSAVVVATAVCLNRNCGFLCLESGICYVEPERAIFSCDQRRTANHDAVSRRSVTGS